MATVRISIHLPYLLGLPPGEYPTPGVGGSVRLADDAEAQERQRQAETDRPLRCVNRLLRWYPVTTG